MVRRIRERGHPGGRAGFTLVELLVVITIIAVLMAMVFPALNVVMARFRLNNCSRQMQELGRALSLYQSNNQSRWPSVSSQPVDTVPGSSGQVVRGRVEGASGYSWLVALLPYIEQDVLSQEISAVSNNMQIPAFDAKIVSSDKRHYATFPVAMYQCPEQVGEPARAPEYSNLPGGQAARSSYVAISATHLDLVVPPMATSRSRRPTAEARPVDPNGVIIYRPGGVRNFLDGPSSTLIATETRELAYAAWFDGTTSWVVGHDPNSPAPQMVNVGGKQQLRCEGECRLALNVGPDRPLPGREGGEPQVLYYRASSTWSGKENWEYGPSSTHIDGMITHLFAGGNVRPLRSTGTGAINPTLYLHMITRDGRELIPDDL
jgi:prepilin-type N-terminal cleavage/methylation domain-containing protein